MCENLFFPHVFISYLLSFLYLSIPQKRDIVFINTNTIFYTSSF